MPIIGQDREATERFMKEMQKKHETTIKEIDEIRTKLLQEKELPLDKRTEISYRAPIEFLYTYPGLERQYSKDYISNLAKDIEKHGIIQKPVCTLDFSNKNTPLSSNETNQHINLFIFVVCGNARVNASKELGKSFVDISIKYLERDEVFDISLSENDNRNQLNPIARAIQFKNWGISQTEIAKKRNKTQPWVSLHFRMLTLPNEVQELIIEDKISTIMAQILLQIDNAKTQIELAKLCAEGLLTTSELKSKVDKAKTKAVTINVSPDSTEADSTKPEQQLGPIDTEIMRVFPAPKNIDTQPIIPQKNPEAQLNPSENAVHFLNDSINKAIKSIEDKEGVELLFKSNLLTMYYHYKDCKGNCRNCERFNECKQLEEFVRTYLHYPIPEIPFNY